MNEVKFSIKSHAKWVPGRVFDAMPAILRRRASTSGKMALEAAYECLGEARDIPVVFCSRHGECERSANLLDDLVRDIPLSPTSFSLSVHNATGGLFSIARRDHANSLAISAGKSSIEHAVIEACGLLTDGNSEVLLVAYDNNLPDIFKDFQDPTDQSYAWAWLMELPKEENSISLSWKVNKNESDTEITGSEIYDFFINKSSYLERISNGRCWQWKQ